MLNCTKQEMLVGYKHSSRPLELSIRVWNAEHSCSTFFFFYFSVIKYEAQCHFIHLTFRLLAFLIRRKELDKNTQTLVNESIALPLCYDYWPIRLHHGLDGINNSKYKLFRFIQLTICLEKRRGHLLLTRIGAAI
jgi:hypothetical protein